MRKTIKIGEKELEFEANLGTTELYQELTGKNLFELLSQYRGIKETDPEAYSLVDVYKRMMFVMNTQATQTEIKAMRAKMNLDSYLEWVFQFETQDITNEVIKDIVQLWKGSRTNHSESKNP